MDDMSRRDVWQNIGQGNLDHAESMGRFCEPRFAELMRDSATRFIEQPIPSCDDEFNWRQLQSTAVSSLIGAIAHGGSMARMEQGAADSIFEAVKEFCNQPLPQTKEEIQRLTLALIGLTSEIGSLTHAANMERMRSLYR